MIRKRYHSLPDIWNAGYKTQSLAQTNNPSMEQRPTVQVITPEGVIIGYAATSTEVLDLIHRHLQQRK